MPFGYRVMGRVISFIKWIAITDVIILLPIIVVTVVRKGLQTGVVFRI